MRQYDRPSGLSRYSQENASTEPVEAGVTIHLSLDGFEPVDLSFSLVVATRGGEGSAYRIDVFCQPGSKRFHRRHMTFAGFGEPGIQFSTSCHGVGLVADVAPTHQGGEPVGESGHGRGVLILLNTCDRYCISRWQCCGGLHEQLRELPGGRQWRWRTVIH